MHAIPNPDHPPLEICLTYQLFCTEKKSSVSYQIKHRDLMFKCENFQKFLWSQFNSEFWIILLSESESIVSLCLKIVFIFQLSKFWDFHQLWSSVIGFSFNFKNFQKIQQKLRKKKSHNKTVWIILSVVLAETPAYEIRQSISEWFEVFYPTDVFGIFDTK